MIPALIWKELRGLKAFVWLIVGVESIGLIFTLATEMPDAKPLNLGEQALNSSSSVLIFFALLLGASLLLREATDGTLHFLDGLPISRSRIFLAKIIAGILVLSLVPLLEIVPELLWGLLSRTSVDAPFPWPFVTRLLLLYLFATVCLLCVISAMALLGRWFALVSGLTVVAILALQMRGVHWVDYLKPTALLPKQSGSQILLPYRHMAVQGGMALAALALAWWRFQSLGARSRDTADRASPFLRFVLLLTRIAVPVVWIVAIVLAVRSSGFDPEESSAPGGESAFVSQKTESYEFLFRDGQRNDVTPLLKYADWVHGRVAEFFGMLTRKDRIVADLDSPIPSHTLGVTNWTKIRVRVFPKQTEPDFRRVLGHETAHVLMQEIGGQPFVHDGNSTRFFNEGLATAVETKYFDNPEQVASLHRFGAAAISRGAVPFHLLCDDDALGKTRDQTIAYPLGLAFCEALISVCGEHAPTRILEEFKRGRFQGSFQGESLWREILQRCGYSLDSVISAYDAELSRWQTEEAEYLKRLPMISSTSTSNGDRVVVHPKYTGAAPGRLVCCVEYPGGIAPDTKWYYAGPDGSISIPRAKFTGVTFRYMMGWSINGEYWPVFGTWTEAAL